MKDALHRELLTIKDLSVDFTTKQGTVHALKNISLELTTRQILGIAGESGSGKSVSMLSIMNLLAPNASVVSGSIQFEGKELSPLGLKNKKEKNEHEKMMKELRGRDIAMIFQDPMTYLNPVLRIGVQMTEGIRKHTGCSKKEAMDKAADLLEQVGISNPQKRLRQYPYEFSGGMRQRIIIATALACDPKLIIADEPTTALDVTVQAQILDLIEKSVKEMGASAIVITHDLGVVAKLCDNIAIMYGGEIVEYGTADDIFYDARHPYTKGLLASIPKKSDVKEPLPYIPGTPVNMLKSPKGCRFCSRCSAAMRICKEYHPQFTQWTEDHGAMCWLYCKDRAEQIVQEQDGQSRAAGSDTSLQDHS